VTRSAIDSRTRPKRMTRLVTVHALAFGGGFLLGYFFREVAHSMVALAPGEEVSNMWSTIQSLLTSLAIVVGGGWFLIRRGLMPRADVSHAVTHHWLDSHTLWIRSSVTVRNRGDVLIELPESDARLLQVLPLRGQAGERIVAHENARPRGRTDVNWPELDTCEDADKTFHVEPGESDTQNWDFVVYCDRDDDRPELVILYHHLKNPVKPPVRERPVGWCVETVHDVRPSSGAVIRQADPTPPASAFVRGSR